MKSLCHSCLPPSFTVRSNRWASLATGVMLAGSLLAAPPATETHVFKQVGPLAIKADVWRPAGSAPTRPVLVCLHGGSLINGGREMAAEFARHGVEHRLVLLPEGEHGFRGADPAIVAAARRDAVAFVIRQLSLITRSSP